MRELERVERISNLFQAIWHRFPDMRFGQLYENLLTTYMHERNIKFSQAMAERIMWTVEDSDFEHFLINFKEFK